MDACVENILELQYADNNATPLFLIHDGGGTILKYLSLEDIGRNVYGIQDPKLDCDDGWEGGITEMASEYIKLIRSIRHDGSIILGGWSLGGLVSLQIARLLDNERERHRAEHGAQSFSVAGVILIDSPYTPPLREIRDCFASLEPDFPPWTAGKTRKIIKRRFEVCDEMIDKWDPPHWNAYSGHSPESLSNAVATATRNKGPNTRATSTCPPVVLLKATALVPVAKSEAKPDAKLDIDLFRDDPCLGWMRHANNLFTAVYPVSGNHFNLFDEDERVRLPPLRNSTNTTAS